jgi:hypothetical protein
LRADGLEHHVDERGVAGGRVFFAIEDDDSAGSAGSCRNLQAVVRRDAGNPILYLLGNIHIDVGAAGGGGDVDREWREISRPIIERDTAFGPCAGDDGDIDAAGERHGIDEERERGLVDL